VGVYESQQQALLPDSTEFGSTVVGQRTYQLTEYGQGWRRIPIYSSKTTDFGMPYTQFNPANVNPEKTGQLLVPTAVITNF
jgi:hypothetical protein